MPNKAGDTNNGTLSERLVSQVTLYQCRPCSGPFSGALHGVPPPVDHGPQDLRGHHNAVGVGVDGHVAGHEPNVPKLLAQLAELLVGEGLMGEGDGVAFRLN